MRIQNKSVGFIWIFILKLWDKQKLFVFLDLFSENNKTFSRELIFYLILRHCKTSKEYIIWLFYPQFVSKLTLLLQTLSIYFLDHENSLFSPFLVEIYFSSNLQDKKTKKGSKTNPKTATKCPTIPLECGRSINLNIFI